MGALEMGASPPKGGPFFEDQEQRAGNRERTDEERRDHAGVAGREDAEAGMVSQNTRITRNGARIADPF